MSATGLVATIARLICNMISIFHEMYVGTPPLLIHGIQRLIYITLSLRLVRVVKVSLSRNQCGYNLLRYSRVMFVLKPWTKAWGGP